MTSRLKIMAELDIAERRAPQDGRMSIRYGLRLALAGVSSLDEVRRVTGDRLA